MCLARHKKSACKAEVLDNEVFEEEALCLAELFVKKIVISRLYFCSQ